MVWKHLCTIHTGKCRHVSAEWTPRPRGYSLAWEREFDKVSFEGSKIENKTQNAPLMKELLVGFGIIKESGYICMYQTRSAHKINMYYEKLQGVMSVLEYHSQRLRDLFLKLQHTYRSLSILYYVIRTPYGCLYAIRSNPPCTCRLRLRRIASVGAAPSPFLHTFSASPGLNFIES